MTEYIVSLSGGKDSTALLLMMLERGMPVDRVIYVDTTKEFPQMYAHLDKLERETGMSIERASFDFDYWFGKRIKTKGKRKGEVGYGWPNHFNRWCTDRKVGSFLRAATKGGMGIKSEYVAKGIIEYHGIAANEKHRIKRRDQTPWREIRYPLVAWGKTEADCLQYCYDHGYDWGGLYEKFQRASCYCCPLSRLGELRVVHDEFPELWDKMRQMDKLSRRPFRKDYTLCELEQKFA